MHSVRKVADNSIWTYVRKVTSGRMVAGTTSVDGGWGRVS